jgi:hypothetical protein
MAKDRVLLDTCIIIEAFRVNCWKALCARYDVETVEKCVEEACTGDPLNPKRVPIDRKLLTSGLARVHPVTDLERATFSINNAGLPGLDDGELHLLAWLHANQPIPITLLISTTDKAALKAVHMLSWLSHVSSLETLGRAAGMDKKQLQKLEAHFLEPWMAQVRLQCQQGIL